MKTGTIKAAGAILLATLVLDACGKQSTAKANTHNSDVQQLSTDVSALYQNDKYDLPAKTLDNKGINKAEKQYHKVYKLRGDLSTAQKKALTVSKTSLATAKQALAAKTELNKALGTDKTVKDAKYTDTAIQKDLQGPEEVFAKIRQADQV